MDFFILDLTKTLKKGKIKIYQSKQEKPLTETSADAVCQFSYRIDFFYLKNNLKSGLSLHGSIRVPQSSETVVSLKSIFKIIDA